MQRWEYKIVTGSRVKDVEHEINELGEAGWEAVSLRVGYYESSERVACLLKRPKK